MTTDNRLVVTSSTLRVPIVLIAIGVIAFVVGLFISAERAWLNLLIDGFYVLSLGVAAIFFIASQRLARSQWWVPLQRIPEAFMSVLPAAAVLMIALAFGFPSLYEWTDPASFHHEHALVRPGRETYLAPAFVYARMIVAVALWLFFAWRVRKISLAGDADRTAGLRSHGQLYRLSAVFVLVFAVSFTTAAYDWIMSLEPRWLSTMFSVYVFAGSFVQSIAAIALATVTLKRKRLFGSRDALFDGDLIQTLGTMILAFSTFWAYIWVAQYLLVWYSDIPEEATYFLRRTSGGWTPVFLVNVVVNWVIPFLVLLPRSSKRSLQVMTAISVFVLFGRWFDLYLLVMPSHWPSPKFGPLEIAMAAGTAGLIYVMFVRGLSRAPLVPSHEPSLAARHGHAPHAQGAAS